VTGSQQGHRQAHRPSSNGKWNPLRNAEITVDMAVDVALTLAGFRTSGLAQHSATDMPSQRGSSKSDPWRSPSARALRERKRVGDIWREKNVRGTKRIECRERTERTGFAGICSPRHRVQPIFVRTNRTGHRLANLGYEFDHQNDDRSGRAGIILPRASAT
jgi:hypothetical protein